MGLFDLGNKTEAYKKGISDSSEIDAKKMEEVKRAVDATASEQAENNESIRQGFNDIYDMQDVSDKEQLLGIDNSVKLLDLDEQDRSYLIGTLYSIGLDSPKLSSAQKKYFNQLKGYLGVENPYEVDLAAVGGIDDIEVAKSIFKVVMEFDYLEDKSWTFETSEDYVSYSNQFRLNQQDKLRIKKDIEDLLHFGNDSLGRQYVIHRDFEENKTTQENSSKIEHPDDSENTGNTSDDERTQSFEKVLSMYLQPETAFKSVGAGVEFVQKSRELLYDQLNLSVEMVSDFCAKVGMSETLDNYRDKIEQYAEEAKRISKEKREANVASGKKSKTEIVFTVGLLPVLPLILSPALLMSMKGNKKSQDAYIKDLIRLNTETVDAAKVLHDSRELATKTDKDQVNYLVLSDIDKAVSVLMTSYDQLSSVDFRMGDLEEDARNKTRKYLSVAFSDFNRSEPRKPILLYKKNAEKPDSGYLSKKEVDGIFSKIMEYEGAPDELVGAIDTSIGHLGKSGIVFLDDSLVIRKVIGKPVSIPYKSIDGVVGKRIMAHDDDGNMFEADLDKDDIDLEKAKEILDTVKNFWLFSEKRR
ncbi:hypothetical protein [Levilactobacillus fuyuanensis]|uniref:LXG domain of WXG superfamily protein n=1 Tax=Levilactobacillus fuyuanensis TaxID=2486022 RepID=A0ABW4H6D2_9LACO|nr:hypothetical protein [Levilactobacillus fuyuanensis]